MNPDTIFKIQHSSLLSQYLQDHSYEYRNLYRDDSYVNVLEEKAREFYHVRYIDQLDKWSEKIHLFHTFMNMMD